MGLDAIFIFHKSEMCSSKWEFSTFYARHITFDSHQLFMLYLDSLQMQHVYLNINAKCRGQTPPWDMPRKYHNMRNYLPDNFERMLRFIW